MIAALGVSAFIVFVGGRSFVATRATLAPPRVPVRALAPLPGVREVGLTDDAGVSLRGWYSPSSNGAAVILGHGHGANREQLNIEFSVLADAGFGVAAFDWPGHGESGGQCSWGDGERSALTAVVDFVSTQGDVEPHRIGILGFSMGGTLAIDVAAHDARLAAVLVTGTYSTLEEEIRIDMGRWGPLSQWPALWALRLAGVDLNAVRPIAQVCRIAPRPVLIIDGTEDPSAPMDMEAALFAAACIPKEFWAIEGATHGDYMRWVPKEYPWRVLDFFRRSLGAPL